MAADLRIGIAQLPSVEGDVSGNLQVAEEAVAQLGAQGARLVILPEMHVTGLLGGGSLARLAETPQGETWTRLREIAARHRVTLVTSLPEAVPEEGRYYNTALVAGPEGQILGTYRKIHLFDGEALSYAPGSGLTHVTVDGITCGLLICYDLEFPEVTRSLARPDCAVFLVPSANMVPWGHHHRTFVMARALENHAYVAYANRCGKSSKYQFVGESALCDPFGRVQAEAGIESSVLVVDIHLSEVARSRQVFDYLKERRLDYREKPWL